MGSTLSLLISEKKYKSLDIVILSPCEESIPFDKEAGCIVEECRKVYTEIFGLEMEQLKIYSFPVRRLNEFRQDILEALIQLKEEINPDIIFTTSIYDTHQDHQVVGIETERAFNGTQTILAFEIFKNYSHYKNILYVKCTDDDLYKKMKALECYDSQSHRFYFSKDIIKGIMLARGSQCGYDGIVEAFEVIKMVL